jgi:hypothetical protein
MKNSLIVLVVCALALLASLGDAAWGQLAN